MTFAAIGSAIWKFLKGLPAWVWYVFLIIAAGYFIDVRARNQQRQKDKDAFDKEAREAEAAVVKQIQENSDDLLRQSDVVRSHDAASQLPDGTASLPDYHYRD